VAQLGLSPQRLVLRPSAFLLALLAFQVFLGAGPHRGLPDQQSGIRLLHCCSLVDRARGRQTLRVGAKELQDRVEGQLDLDAGERLLDRRPQAGAQSMRGRCRAERVGRVERGPHGVVSARDELRTSVRPLVYELEAACERRFGVRVGFFHKPASVLGDELGPLGRGAFDQLFHSRKFRLRFLELLVEP
jgi:hypothetical protein